MFRLIECPRDAMQGLTDFVPTEIKVQYLNALLKVGFDTLDFGSFVSPRAIPQLRDTAEVLPELELDGKTKLLAIVANIRGAEEALTFPEIDYLGFPLSLSETFQRRNTNQTIVEALNTVEKIQGKCQSKDRKLVVYLSMGFGNPYGDPYSPEVVNELIGVLKAMGIDIISIADTIGISDEQVILSVLTSAIENNPDLEIGAHLHATPADVRKVVSTALDAGITRLDGALLGFGGCPMAEDKLVGNVPTEQIIDMIVERGSEVPIDKSALAEARRLASNLFATYR